MTIEELTKALTEATESGLLDSLDLHPDITNAFCDAVAQAAYVEGGVEYFESLDEATKARVWDAIASELADMSIRERVIEALEQMDASEIDDYASYMYEEGDQ